MNVYMLGIEHMVEKLMALALSLIVLLIFSNVVGRYVFGTSFAGAEELSRLLFVWLVFLGAILSVYSLAVWTLAYRRLSKPAEVPAPVQPASESV